jgi:hypothetical protein
MPRDPLIGLVGKPSSGKSTTLNRCDMPILSSHGHLLRRVSQQLDRRHLESRSVNSHDEVWRKQRLIQEQVTFRKSSILVPSNYHAEYSHVQLLQQASDPNAPASQRSTPSAQSGTSKSNAPARASPSPTAANPTTAPASMAAAASPSSCSTSPASFPAHTWAKASGTASSTTCATPTP